MQSSNKSERLFSATLLFLLIAFGVFLRVQNRDALEEPYLFGTDSYRYFRQTRQIVESGDLPHIDTMRNSPDGIDNTTVTPLFPYVLANGFAAVHAFLPNLTLYQFAAFSSIFFISLAALLLYAFTKRLFGEIAALFATLVFVSTPYLIFRSFAGYVDTDATIIFLFLGSIYLYYEPWQSQVIWKRFAYTLFSGITISFLGLIWKGVGFAIVVVVFFNFLQLCTKGYDKTGLTQYAIWLFPILVGLFGFTKIYRSQLFSPHVLLAIGIPIGFGIFAALFIGIQSRNIQKFCSPLLNKVPLGLRMSVLFLFLGCIILTLISGGLNWISTLIDAIFYPFGKNGIMEFVNELHPTTFNRWREVYGLLLFFAIPGLCLLTNTRTPRKRSTFLLHCLLTGIALFGIAISRFVPLLAVPLPWFIDSLIFAIAAALIIANTLYQFSFTTDQATTDQATTDTVNENYALLISAWFIPSYMLACSAQRFHVFLAPVVAILSGYMLDKLFKKYMPQTESSWHPLVFLGVLLSWQVLVCGKDIFTFLMSILSFSHLSLSLPEIVEFLITLFVTAIFFGFILQNLFYRKQTQYSVKKACALIGVCLLTWLSIIGIYRLGPTQISFRGTLMAQPTRDRVTLDALNGIKTKIPSHAVIAADWNFGSLTNEIGRRTTIVDEEQNLAKIRGLSKAVFLGTNEEEALQFLKEHKATHLLLHPSDILQLNLHFFAAEPLRENTRQFYPGTRLTLTEKTDQKLEYVVDTPVSIKINTEPPLQTVTRMSLPFKWENESFSISTPASIVINADHPEQTFSVKELIIADRQWYFPEAKIGGCVWIPSEIVRDRPLEFMDPIARYISPEARESLAVKLFLGEHSAHFKLVYKSPSTYGPIPVKIWEIHYEE